MALWGISTSDEAKPKYLTADQKKNTFADSRGWVYRDPNTGLEEVLVAIGELSGSAGRTGLGAPTISSVKFVTAALDNAATVITVDVVYNEGVTVTGNPTIVVRNGNESLAGNGDYTLTYTSTGSTKNRKRFTATGLVLAATDVLTLGGVGQADIALAGGTMVDTADGSTNAELTASDAAAVTVTVTAA